MKAARKEGEMKYIIKSLNVNDSRMMRSVDEMTYLAFDKNRPRASSI